MHELDRKIKQCKSVVSSLETSYKIINEFDVDGFPIDDVELEFLNLKEEKEIENNLINNTEQLSNQDEFDDLDGEPI